MVYSPYALLGAGIIGLAIALIAYFANEHEKQKEAPYRRRPSEKKDSPNCTDYSMCIVCNENQISIKYMPCGHSYVCDECNIRLRRHSNQCIHCHKRIDRYVRI
ncbi:hypothetical protein CEXT_429571 [Caerostris extrusa]|uniref:RING-type domain-containing protein n=1 Tax=Caerostris extrusa TaxID=172846 RepID=A0AAV4PCH8_CAEEX|nr:hypothetical protein CEXT_429571 [Caerostris extrusa]